MTHPAPVAWYRHLNHTSDLGCEVLGNTQSELFAHAGQALFSLLIPLEQVEERDTVPINVSGIDLIDLWVTFLRELLYLVNGRHFLVHTVVIDRLDETTLSATVHGEPWDKTRHRLLREIKAVTYHGAEVTHTPQGWRGIFICDI